MNFISVTLSSIFLVGIQKYKCVRVRAFLVEMTISDADRLIDFIGYVEGTDLSLMEKFFKEFGY